MMLCINKTSKATPVAVGNAPQCKTPKQGKTNNKKAATWLSKPENNECPENKLPGLLSKIFYI
jgi:hypothetical protein